MISIKAIRKSAAKQNLPIPDRWDCEQIQMQVGMNLSTNATIEQKIDAALAAYYSKPSASYKYTG